MYTRMVLCMVCNNTIIIIKKNTDCLLDSVNHQSASISF